jgi:hypothetical protein
MAYLNWSLLNFSRLSIPADDLEPAEDLEEETMGSDRSGVLTVSSPVDMPLRNFTFVDLS